MGAEVPRDAWSKEVRPAPEHAAPAEEQGEHGDAHRGSEESRKSTGSPLARVNRK